MSNVFGHAAWPSDRQLDLFPSDLFPPSVPDRIPDQQRLATTDGRVKAVRIGNGPQQFFFHFLSLFINKLE